jgi:hypothetical protein
VTDVVRFESFLCLILSKEWVPSRRSSLVFETFPLERLASRNLPETHQLYEKIFLFFGREKFRNSKRLMKFSSPL